MKFKSSRTLAILVGIGLGSLVLALYYHFTRGVDGARVKLRAYQRAGLLELFTEQKLLPIILTPRPVTVRVEAFEIQGNAIQFLENLLSRPAQAKVGGTRGWMVSPADAAKVSARILEDAATVHPAMPWNSTISTVEFGRAGMFMGDFPVLNGKEWQAGLDLEVLPGRISNETHLQFYLVWSRLMTNAENRACLQTNAVFSGEAELHSDERLLLISAPEGGTANVLVTSLWMTHP